MRYLLWDHDGVLVDTERWYFEASRVILNRLGVTLSESQYLDLMAEGRGGWDLARDHGVSETEIRTRRDERNTLYQEYIRTKPIEIDGVDEVLDDLGRRHEMGIVTTARRSDFTVIHEHRDLLRHFQFALTVEDYPRAKPQPDPYLAGLAQFEAGPDEAIAIEDSSRGLAAARAAGVRCIVIRNPFTATQDFTGAWRIVDSIRDVPSVLAD